MSAFESLSVRPHVTRILMSVVWIAAALWLIARGNAFGWFLLPGWLVVLALWIALALRNRVKS